MKFLVIFAIVATFAWVIDGAAIDTDEVQTVEDAPVVPVDDVNDECYQPKITGRCFALFNRFAFNVESRACEEFIYGGCGGNTNNFETKEECESKCLGTKSEDSESDSVVPTEETTTEIGE